jgi:cytochrome c-type biogenesis protein CcmH/NrfG
LPFAVERLDTWVVRVGLTVPLVCLVVLGLWHLIGFLAGKLPRKPRTYRQSPEPPEAFRLPADDPERLQQACAALEHTLAERYMELAESWTRRGQSQQAAAAYRKVVQLCPDRPEARAAQDRLQQIQKEKPAV